MFSLPFCSVLVISSLSVSFLNSSNYNESSSIAAGIWINISILTAVISSVFCYSMILTVPF